MGLADKPYSPNRRRPPASNRRETMNVVPGGVPGTLDYEGRAVGAVVIQGGEVRERQPNDTDLAALWGSGNPVAPPPASAQAWPSPLDVRVPFKNLRR